MAIAYRGAGALATSTTGTLTPALPSGTAKDDFLVAHITNGGNASPATPAGWTLATTYQISTTHRIHLYWKFAATGETAPSFTGGITTNGMWGAISSYTGVPIRANPFHVAPVGSAATFATPNMQGPSMTSTIAGAMAVWMWTTSDNSTTGAAGGGATAAYSGTAYDSTVGLDASTFGAYLLKTSAGATGVVTIAASSGAATGVIRFMLDPTPSTTAPVVNGGADATVVSGSTFNRTATENDGGASITSRSWTVQSGVNPATILNIGSALGKNHFSLQLTRPGDSAITTKTMADIEAGYSEIPYFYGNGTSDAVIMRADYVAPVTSGSSFTRCELRELDQSGNNMAFDATLTGEHYMMGATRITHASAADPEVIIAQLHNGDTGDRVSFRSQLISGVMKIVLRVNGTEVKNASNQRPAESYDTVAAPWMFWKIRVVNNQLFFYYGDMNTPWYTSAAGVFTQTTVTGGVSWYFKAGCYNQADGTSGGTTEYGQIELKNLSHWHTGWTTPAAGTFTPYSIGTAAALSWTPTTPGLYTLRYAATNSIGTGTDDVLVTVNPPAPVVDAGADATTITGVAFTRTAGETNGPTSRAWTIQSGPTGVGTTIGTAAALSWTPSTVGTYTLRYSATNATGTGTDDVVVTVNAPTPVVDAGADASVVNRSTFTRTATETNSPTSRAWTILSGPTGVGSTIGTAAALSWAPSVAGNYVLRYSATNAAGTGTDDVAVTVTVLTIALAGGTTTAQSNKTVTNKLRVATKTITNDPVANTVIVGTPKLRVATKTLTVDPVALTNVIGTPKLRRATKTVTNDPVANTYISGTPKLRVATKGVTNDPVAQTSITGVLYVRRRITLAGGTTTANTVVVKARAVKIRLIKSARADASAIATGNMRIPGSGYFHVEANATGNLRMVKKVRGGTTTANTSAVGKTRVVAKIRKTTTANTTGTAKLKRVNRYLTPITTTAISNIVGTPKLKLVNFHRPLPLEVDASLQAAHLLLIRLVKSRSDASASASAALHLVTRLKKTTTALSSATLKLRVSTKISKTTLAQTAVNGQKRLKKIRLMDVNTTTALTRIVGIPKIQRTVVYHPQVSATPRITPPKLKRVTKFKQYRLVGESEIKERSVRIVLTTAYVDGYVLDNKTRDVHVLSGYVTTVATGVGNLVWRPKWHKATAQAKLTGRLVALKEYSEELRAKSSITTYLKNVRGMSTIIAVMNDDGVFVPVTHHIYDLDAEEPTPVVFKRTFMQLR